MHVIDNFGRSPITFSFRNKTKQTRSGALVLFHLFQRMILVLHFKAIR